MIKEITELNDFKKVYSVFSGPPYNEQYSEEELEAIFNEYKQKGYVYGAYTDEGCIGLIALERGAKSTQPVSFAEKKIMYLADIAVLDEYRRKGLGNKLMLYGVMQSKSLGYEKMYMRTLKEGSMSYGIATKIGFRQIPGVFQGVERQRTNGEIETLQNIFLELDLENLNKDKLKQGINLANGNNKLERERN